MILPGALHKFFYLLGKKNSIILLYHLIVKAILPLGDLFILFLVAQFVKRLGKEGVDTELTNVNSDLISWEITIDMLSYIGFGFTIVFILTKFIFYKKEVTFVKNMEKELTISFLGNFLSLDGYFYRSISISDFINRMNRETEVISQNALTALFSLVGALSTMFLICLFLVVSYGTSIAAVIVVPIIIYFFIQKLTGGIIKASGDEFTNAQKSKFEIISKSIEGLKTIKIFSLTGSVLSYLNFEYAQIVRHYVKYVTMNVFPRYFFEAFVYLAFFLSGLVVTNTEEFESESVSSLIVMLFAMMRILPSMQVVSQSFGHLKFSSKVIETFYLNLVEFREYKSLVLKRNEYSDIDNNKLFISGLCYRPNLNTEFILKASSLIFSEFDKVAVIGESGSGKSSFIDILSGQLRIINSDSGSDFFNSNNFNKRFSYCTQKSFILNATVGENIFLNFEDKNYRKYDLTKLPFLNFIDELPFGFETYIGNGGHQLSIGQEQRIHVARAIIYDADVYVFDESTSALDAENETLVLDSIFKLLEHKMVFFITHGRRVRCYCNRVLRFSEGSILEILD